MQSLAVQAKLILRTKRPILYDVKQA